MRERNNIEKDWGGIECVGKVVKKNEELKMILKKRW